MPKVFNTTAVCIPEEHYMIDLSERLGKTKALVAFFTLRKLFEELGDICLFYAKPIVLMTAPAI